MSPEKVPDIGVSVITRANPGDGAALNGDAVRSKSLCWSFNSPKSPPKTDPGAGDFISGSVGMFPYSEISTSDSSSDKTEPTSESDASERTSSFLYLVSLYEMTDLWAARVRSGDPWSS